VLVEVNIAGEEGRGECRPLISRLHRALPVRVSGLMTMPPFSEDPEASRPYFAALAELAGAHDLPRLSMGTSQDYAVAVQEGATIVRLGTILVCVGRHNPVEILAHQPNWRQTMA